MKSVKVLGIMSGTSLDGLDLCLVNFSGKNSEWAYTILASETIIYHDELKDKLSGAVKLSGETLVQLDVELGRFIGERVNHFLKEDIDFIASHGHTVFHQPENRLTTQIGCGNTIHAVTGHPVICDFRTLDVALGGQGAPLVPIGDHLLFDQYISCINFGGIANLSYFINGNRVAFDICPANMALNTLINEINLPFDDQGKLAATGTILPELLDRLNALTYYSIKGPKSLGIEWYFKHFEPLISRTDLALENRLRTVCEHIATQVSNSINQLETGKILMTGGGAYHSFLMDLIQSKTTHKIIIPEPELIEFKEALIFAFLGLLKHEGQINVLASVTGARQSSSSGYMIGF